MKKHKPASKVEWIIDELILEGFSNVDPGILQTSIGDELSNQWEQDPLLGGRPLAQMMPHHISLETSPNTTTQNLGQKIAHTISQSTFGKATQK